MAHFSRRKPKYGTTSPVVNTPPEVQAPVVPPVAVVKWSPVPKVQIVNDRLLVDGVDVSDAADWDISVQQDMVDVTTFGGKTTRIPGMRSIDITLRLRCQEAEVIDTTQKSPSAPATVPVEEDEDEPEDLPVDRTYSGRGRRRMAPE